VIAEDMKLAAAQLRLNYRRRWPMTLDDMGALADRILVWAEIFETGGRDVGLVAAMGALDQSAANLGGAT
jgi:hypothetical protein